jgi:hypothetical protein
MRSGERWQVAWFAATLLSLPLLMVAVPLAFG